MKSASSFLLGLLVAVLVAGPVDLSAQLVLDVGGGMTFATAYGDDSELSGADKGSRTGFHAGAGLVIPVAGRFAVVPSANYVQKGVKYSAGSDELSYNVDYLVIPVLGSIMLTSGGSVGVNVFFGPEVSLEIGCTQEGTVGGQSASQDCPDADQDERQTMDFGAVVGAGLSFPVGERLSLGVSGGVDLGLRTLDTADDPADVKSRAFFGRVSVGIPLGG